MPKDQEQRSPEPESDEHLETQYHEVGIHAVAAAAQYCHPEKKAEPHHGLPPHLETCDGSD